MSGFNTTVTIGDGADDDPVFYGPEVCYYGPCVNCQQVHGGWEPCPKPTPR
jgi:hypothetical protein